MSPSSPIERASSPVRRATTSGPASTGAVLGLLGLLGLCAIAAAQTAPSGTHSLRLLEPAEGLHVGGLRVGAVVEGAGVARVRFLLDGRLVLSKTRPPFSVELDLGEAPRPHEVVAVAYDAMDRELARDRLRVNEGPFRFSVRLIAPVRGRRYSDSVGAHAEATLPIGEPLARIEFFVGEELAGSVTKPPYKLDLDLVSDEQTYVRAVAYLADGNTAEDLVSINAEHDMEELDISFVELFATVLDRKAQAGRGVDSRRLHHNRRRCAAAAKRRFERVFDRPVHVGVLLDTSTSMQEELRETQKAAKAFFERIVRPRDRATVITFSDEPAVKVPFSNDLELLAAGLQDLQAEGETTLFDSLAFSLYYFGGLKGKRALVVLTDGADSMSRFSLVDVIEFAQRLGVCHLPDRRRRRHQGLRARKRSQKRWRRPLAAAPSSSSGRESWSRPTSASRRS